MSKSISTDSTNKRIRIKWFIVFKHGPGDGQHLSGQFDAGFGFNTAFSVPMFKHSAIQSSKVFVVIRSDQRCLIKAISQVGITFFRDFGHTGIAGFAAGYARQGCVSTVQAGWADVSNEDLAKPCR